MPRRGPEQFLKRGREKVGELRRTAAPIEGDLLGVVAEVGEVQFEAAVANEFHDAAHLRQEAWRSVGRQPHHFVFVAVMRKAEILRDRLIENAERMREQRPALDVDGRASPTPQAALAKSPKPSTETTTASSNGET